MTIARTTILADPTNYRVGRLHPVFYIVIHTGETSEGNTAAEGMGSWFGQRHAPGAASSAHQGADTDSICTYVRDADTAYGAPGVNSTGWHLELAGRAGQSVSDWADAASGLILANGAVAAAEAAQRLTVPARWLSDDELRSGTVRGFITHNQASRVLGGTHWDPGPNFPADKFMGLVRAQLAPASPIPNLPAVPRTDPLWGVKLMQRTLHQTADGLWGPSTDAAWLAIRAATWSGARFDAAWRMKVQGYLGLVQDGVFGPKTMTALLNAVKAAQTALRVTPDGAWGPGTEKAFQYARTRNMAAYAAGK